MNYKIKEENKQLKVYNEKLDTLEDYVLISSKEWEYLNSIKNKYQRLTIEDGKVKIVYKEDIMLDDLKHLLVDLLKQNLKKYIYSVYPQDKQIDIVGRMFGYNDTDFEEMQCFFNKMQDKYKERKNKIMSCKIHSELLNIELDFNGD
ncbi:hypothetical protein [uncultured Clostridium sp.]|uniref:hypothetical protein n=1 Tax=uncultured Clostridium sp. TaxID=59620 RepID=UPI0025ED26F1|nr:hypothetical protein [uncultured Clostridium sp.]